MKFNDPFDHQIGFKLGPDADRFGWHLLEACKRILFDAAPVIVKPSKLTALLLMIRSRASVIPKQQMLQRLDEMCRDIGVSMDQELDSLNEVLRQQLCHSQVFCVTEKNDNLVMWSHYAEEHKGVVFKLRCLEEVDNALLAAEPVRYTDEFISFPSSDDYARHLTGERPFDLLSLIWEMAVTKHKDWAYEREWRVRASLTHEPVGDGFAYYNEDPRVFEAIYLGCRMEAVDKSAIATAVRQHLPRVKIYESVLSKRAFGMEFSEYTET